MIPPKIIVSVNDLVLFHIEMMNNTMESSYCPINIYSNLKNILAYLDTIPGEFYKEVSERLHNINDIESWYLDTFVTGRYGRDVNSIHKALIHKIEMLMTNTDLELELL